MNKSSFPVALPTTVLIRLIFNSPCNALSGMQTENKTNGINKKMKKKAHTNEKNTKFRINSVRFSLKTLTQIIYWFGKDWLTQWHPLAVSLFVCFKAQRNLIEIHIG